ncbi:MAG: MOSC domain-containing protein [Opitutaceae bacterium]
MDVVIRHLFISPGHNFFGRHGLGADHNPTLEVQEIVCRAGQGVEGDRFFDYKANYPGQITFFSWDIYQAAKQQFSLPALLAGAFRRNVVIEGVDITTLIGRRFMLGGVEFEGMVESKPCYWMDQAVAPGAEKWLRGNGGLRAKILSDGPLAVGASCLGVVQPVA